MSTLLQPINVLIEDGICPSCHGQGGTHCHSADGTHDWWQDCCQCDCTGEVSGDTARVSLLSLIESGCTGQIDVVVAFQLGELGREQQIEHMLLRLGHYLGIDFSSLEESDLWNHLTWTGDLLREKAHFAAAMYIIGRTDLAFQACDLALGDLYRRLPCGAS